jgi:hypothetical protein
MSIDFKGLLGQGDITAALQEALERIETLEATVNGGGV